MIHVTGTYSLCRQPKTTLLISGHYITCDKLCNFQRQSNFDTGESSMSIQLFACACTSAILNTTFASNSIA